MELVTTPTRNMGSIGSYWGNQWFISPDHKALFLVGVVRMTMKSEAFFLLYGTILSKIGDANLTKNKQKP